MPDRVTYQTIADAVGVSKMAVSKALRSHPSIPAATRQRIVEAAERLGYRPNPMVAAYMSSLRQNRKAVQSANLAYLQNSRRLVSQTAHGPLFELYQGARLRAEELGYNLVEVSLEEGHLSAARIAAILRAQGILGVLMAPVGSIERELDLDWGNITYAALGHSLRHSRIHRAASHQFHAFETALEKLRAKGYRRIGFSVDAYMDERIGHVWSAAYARHYLLSPPEERVEMLVTTVGWPALRDEFLDWVHRERPDVVIADSIARLDWLRAAGVEVPGQIAFSTLSWEESRPEVSGMRKDLIAVGAAGIDLVVNQLNRNERGLPARPQTVLVTGDWMEGKTA